MFEFQINVAIDGKFFFRTEWEVDKKRVNEAALSFIDHYGVDSVTVRRRNRVMEVAVGFYDIDKLLNPH